MNFIGILFVVALPITFVVTVWYYVALFKFLRILKQERPQALALAREKRPISISNLQASYLVLRGVKDSAFCGCKLSIHALRARQRANRLLYIGMFSFMVALTAILIVSVTKG